MTAIALIVALVPNFTFVTTRRSDAHLWSRTLIRTTREAPAVATKPYVYIIYGN